VQEPYVGSDESGDKDGGMKHWAWCFRAAPVAVFHIDPSRSSDVLKAILTETFGGVVGFFCDALNAHFQQEAAPSLLR